MHETQALRWKIITFGAFILCAGFAVSLFLVSGLAKPVDQIVAGSVENFARRQEAEENLRAANQELEKALSELKATQRQMIQQERLRALGQMASGIAHDFNNTLTPILGFSEILLSDEEILRNPAEARRLLEMLNTSAHDAASVVNRLLNFTAAGNGQGISCRQSNENSPASRFANRAKVEGAGTGEWN